MLNHYLVRVCVFLNEQITVDDEELPDTLVGYYRNFGVTCVSSEAARALVEQSVEDGTIDWSDSNVDERDLNYWDEEITKHCKEPNEAGIWYQSGRVFFPK